MGVKNSLGVRICGFRISSLSAIWISCMFFLFLSFFFFNLFTWLCQVVIAACWFFSCGMGTLSWGTWHLVPWPGIEPSSPALGGQSLSHWTIRESPQLYVLGQASEHFQGLSFLICKLFSFHPCLLPALTQSCEMRVVGSELSTWSKPDQLNPSSLWGKCSSSGFTSCKEWCSLGASSGCFIACGGWLTGSDV